MLQKLDGVEQGATVESTPTVVQGLTTDNAESEKNGNSTRMEQRILISDDSDTDDYSSIDADNEREDDYVGIDRNVFKTSDRLIDDIFADLLFLGSNEVPESLRHGIIGLAGIQYSQYLSQLKYNPYDIYIPPQTGVSAEGAAEYFDSPNNPNDKITIIRALIFSNSEATMSKSKVYHLRIAIKVKGSTNKGVSKHEFHLCELSEEDASDLTSTSVAHPEDPQEFKELAPVILDCASYVCCLTKTAVRIEISQPEFDETDLHDYEIGPIQVRHIKARQSFPDLSDTEPSPAECLHTLYRAMRGPLVAVPGHEVRTINAGNKSLNLHINPGLLTRKLHFHLTENEYFPPDVYASDDRLQNFLRESFIRQLLEIMFLGTKAFSAGRENPFSKLKFTTSRDLIFRALDDNASVQNHQFVQDVKYVNLSAYPFYSDQLIINCFTKMTHVDPSNKPTYFDALKEISQKHHNIRLTKYVTELQQSGVVGQKDINIAYKTLGIDLSQVNELDEDILLVMYKDETTKHPFDGRLRHSLGVIATANGSVKLKRFLKYEPLPLNQAYETLDVDPSIDDDLIPTALMIKRNETENESNLLRALVTIAVHRATPYLLNLVEVECSDLVDDMTFEEACEYLGMDRLASDTQAITIFESSRNKENIMKSRKALRVVGSTKGSNMIIKYLQDGSIDHNALPPDQWPVALVNTGNSCYLNSLLQYYFSIKPFRDAILNFNDVFNDQEIYKGRRIGGRFVGADEIERSFQFTYHLRNLFNEMIHTKDRLVTPEGALQFLAFLSSTVKVDFGNDEDNKPGVGTDVKSIKGEVSEGANGRDPTESGIADLIDLGDESTSSGLLEDFTMGGTASPDVIPEGQTQDHEVLKPVESMIVPGPKAARISDAEMAFAVELGTQQDVTECIGNVLSQIEAAFKPEGFDATDDNEQQDFVKDLFFGKTIQHLTSLADPHATRDQVVRYSWLFVNINDLPRNLYDALDGALMRTEVVDIGEEKYKRTERIVELPKILQLQVSRVFYDAERMMPYKNSHQLPFPQIVHMDRYLDTTDPDLIKRRVDVEKWKEEIQCLKIERGELLSKNESGMSHKASLKLTLDWLWERKLADDETVSVLNKQIKKIDERLLDIYNGINELESKIDHHFDGFQKHGYKIFAIFIHRGMAEYGHYWIYIKDEKSNLFRKYNDELVTELSAEEVFDFHQGNDATPYFVAYVREDCGDFIEPLCRQIRDSSF